MQTRRPVVAGRFYPAVESACKKELRLFEKSTHLPTLPDTIAAGIVPHAGWTFSGQIAELVFAAIKAVHETVDTFVIFGAAHRYLAAIPAVYGEGAWQTPLGDVTIDKKLADEIIENQVAVSDTGAHNYEHSIEVQVPFILYHWPQAKIVPIITPPSPQAIPLGQVVGKIAAASTKKIICLGSTDLTHYGPNYGFTPKGVGEQSLKWANEVNDADFIENALKMDVENMLISSLENMNACGAGAAAATVSAAKKQGKTTGILLGHTDSSQVMREKMGTSSLDSVGYAAIIF